jgi:hypothetical protein
MSEIIIVLEMSSTIEITHGVQVLLSRMRNTVRTKKLNAYADP